MMFALRAAITAALNFYTAYSVDIVIFLRKEILCINLRTMRNSTMDL